MLDKCSLSLPNRLLSVVCAHPFKIEFNISDKLTKCTNTQHITIHHVIIFRFHSSFFILGVSTSPLTMLSACYLSHKCESLLIFFSYRFRKSFCRVTFNLIGMPRPYSFFSFTCFSFSFLSMNWNWVKFNQILIIV